MDLQAPLPGPALHVVGELMGQRAVKLVLPVLLPPVLLLGQGGKGAVVQIDELSHHTAVAVFPHDVELLLRELRIVLGLGQQADAPVELVVKFRWELLGHPVQQLPRLFKGQDHFYPSLGFRIVSEIRFFFSSTSSTHTVTTSPTAQTSLGWRTLR